MEEFSKGPEDDSLDSLEESGTVIESDTASSKANNDSGGVATPPQNTPNSMPGGPKPPHRSRLLVFLRRFTNIYVVLFCVILLIAVAIVVIAVVRNHGSSASEVPSQTLTQSTVDQLANTNSTVGDARQVLNVESNAVFAGTVLVRSDLEVAGKIKVGGPLSLTGITVSGSSVFDQMQINKNLAVGGDTSLQGLTVQKALTVNGSGTFHGALSAPQLTVSSLQLNGDLTLTHHVVPGGPNPSRSYGSALGSGGSASVSGSDTAGSVTINTGSNPGAGCFATITFTQRFTSTPHVIATPVGSAASGLHYYINRSTSNFSICTTSAAPASSTFGFDYWAVD